MNFQVHRLTSDLLFQLSQVGLHQRTILWEEMALVSLSEELFGSQNQDDRAEMKFMVLMILFQNSKAALKQKFRSNRNLFHSNFFVFVRGVWWVRATNCGDLVPWTAHFQFPLWNCGDVQKFTKCPHPKIMAINRGYQKDFVQCTQS